ncbi:MBL fold metallo-hydrolase [Actinotalea sp. M2MS4P-6]|uniref:MBL fold metallo-hydrolase n=1 Tax=Actinotalea sp. M2MS4P-6 TaxID=2983762 RepID=UPI0021E42102|nr:MBL fold metallo-hydrolase [Actinotalea sp. M2MS4P-6]MCV2394830.1 MBL fold metallo-hydrolase [Actinotalea sp. M2MS4P-6]
MKLTWWGHASVLVVLEGISVVADPVLRARPGLLRHVAPPPSVAWQRPDAVVLSHLHHDHCDLPSLRALDAPVVLAPLGAGAWLRRKGVRPAQEAAIGETVRIRHGGTVTTVRAEHHGRREPFGPVAESVGHIVAGRRTATWLAGDTALFDGMRDLPELAPRGVIDLAVVPIWGWGPNLGPGHMDPDQAAQAVAMVRARHAVPVHWGSLHPAGMHWAMSHHLHTPGWRFAEAVSRHSPQTEVHLLAHGDTIAL